VSVCFPLDSVILGQRNVGESVGVALGLVDVEGCVVGPLVDVGNELGRMVGDSDVEGVSLGNCEGLLLWVGSKLGSVDGLEVWVGTLLWLGVVLGSSDGALLVLGTALLGKSLGEALGAEEVLLLLLLLFSIDFRS